MQVMKEPAGKLVKPSTSVLDASPVFSSRTKPRVEEMKEKVEKGTEYGLVHIGHIVQEPLKFQVREEGVCSPGFIAGLRERYDSNAREKERQIQREIAKRDFHHSKSEEAVKDVHERITRHLTITEVQLISTFLFHKF